MAFIYTYILGSICWGMRSREKVFNNSFDLFLIGTAAVSHGQGSDFHYSRLLWSFASFKMKWMRIEKIKGLKIEARKGWTVSTETVLYTWKSLENESWG